MKARISRTVAYALAIAHFSSLGLFLTTPAKAADLKTLDHKTPAQRNVSFAIQDSWDQVTSFAGFTDLQTTFIMDVNDLVQTSFDLQDDPRSTDSGLGLTEPELLASLQEYAHEEVATQSTGATEVSNGQNYNLINRMQALRHGASGVSFSGLALELPDRSLPAYALWTGLEDQTSGGGASADNPTPWGFFVNGIISFGDRDETADQDGFDFDSVALTGGVDYRFSEHFVAGAAVGYSKLDADIDHDAGDMDTHSIGGSVFAIYSWDNFYLDGALTYSNNDYDTKRKISYSTINTKLDGDTDGDQIGVTAGAGYDAHKGALTYGAFGRVYYLDANIDDYRESGGSHPELALSIEDQDFESLQSSLGINLNYATSHGFGVLVPYARFEWRHEFKNDAQTLGATFINDPFQSGFNVPTDDPDKDFFVLGIGTSLVAKNGVQAFIDYETVLGLDNVTNHKFTLGVRGEF